MTSPTRNAETWLPGMESDANPSNLTTSATASKNTASATAYEHTISTVINNTEDKYIVFKYAQRGFLEEAKWNIDDFEYRFEVKYSIYVLGGDPGSFATGHDATRTLTDEGSKCMLSSINFNDEKTGETKYQKVVAEIVKTSAMNVRKPVLDGGIVPYKRKISEDGGEDGGDDGGEDGGEKVKKAIQGIYGIKINSAHFIGKALKEDGAFSWRFLIHDPKNGTTNKQLFNMSVVKGKVVGEKFFREGDQWLRMNNGIGKNQMCAMNVGPDDMDHVYSWVVEKTDKAEKVKVGFYVYFMYFMI